MQKAIAGVLARDDDSQVQRKWWEKHKGRKRYKEYSWKRLPFVVTECCFTWTYPSTENKQTNKQEKLDKCESILKTIKEPKKKKKKKQQGVTKQKCKERRNSGMQKTELERHFSLKAFVNSGSPGLCFSDCGRSPGSSLGEKFYSTLSSSYPGRPRCCTLKFWMSQALNSPLLATGESIRANFCTKQNRT